MIPVFSMQFAFPVFTRRRIMAQRSPDKIRPRLVCDWCPSGRPVVNSVKVKRAK